MRFWICYQSNVSGPFGPQELARQFPQLGPETLVCPEDSSGEKVGDWKSAKDFAELAPYLHSSAVRTAEAAPARTSFSPPPKPPRFGALGAASVGPSAKHPLAPLVYELVNYMQATQQEVISKEEGAAGLLSRLSAQDEQVRQLSEALNQLRLAPDKNFEQYRREMSALEEKLGKEVGRLRETLRELTDELDSRGEKARRQMAEAFAQKTAEADEHIAQLKGRIGDLQGLIKRADAHIGDTEQKLESFDARLQQSDQRIQQDLKDSGRETEEKLQKLGQQLREFSDTLRRLEQQAQTSQDVKDQHAGERLDLAQKQLELAMSLLKTAEEKSKKQEEELSGLKSFVEGALSAQRDNLAAEMAEATRRAEEKSAEWSQAAQKTALLEERLARTESLEADFRALMADFLEVKKASLAPGELEKLIHRELESKHSDLGTFNSELHAIAERLGALDRQSAELKSFTSGLAGSSGRRLDALETHIPRVGEVFETLHKNREGLELALDQVKEILSLKSGVEESARKQASEAGALAKKVERLERAIEDFGRKFDRLETEPAELRGPGGVRDAAAEAAPAPQMESEWQSAQKNLAEVERMLDEKLPSLEKRIGDWDAREKDLQARLESRLIDEIFALERRLQPAPPVHPSSPISPLSAGLAILPESSEGIAPEAAKEPTPPAPRSLVEGSAVHAPAPEAVVAKPPLEQPALQTALEAEPLAQPGPEGTAAPLAQPGPRSSAQG
ncbi:MAG: hypothetical protein HY611_01705, partial [Elusimicrobia bacterium]|nr:hypothetical protein [Elusimicrobiota bacterium]